MYRGQCDVTYKAMELSTGYVIIKITGEYGERLLNSQL